MKFSWSCSCSGGAPACVFCKTRSRPISAERARCSPRARVLGLGWLYSGFIVRCCVMFHYMVQAPRTIPAAAAAEAEPALERDRGERTTPKRILSGNQLLFLFTFNHTYIQCYIYSMVNLICSLFPAALWLICTFLFSEKLHQWPIKKLFM